MAADRTPVPLRWSRGPGAEGCPGPKWIANALRREVGDEALAQLASTDEVIDAVVWSSGRAWKARVKLVGAGVQGERHLSIETRDCKRVAEAVVLVASLLIRAETDAGGSEVPGSSPGGGSPDPSTDREAPPDVDEGKRGDSDDSPRFHYLLRGAMGEGLLGGLAAGAVAGIRMRTAAHLPWLSVEVAGFLPRGRTQATGVGVSAGALYSSLGLCAPWLRRPAVEGWACAQVDLGAIAAHGEGSGQLDTGVALVANGSFAAFSVVPLSRSLACQFGMSVGTPFVRRSFVARTRDGGLAPLLRPGSLIPTLSAGVVF